MRYRKLKRYTFGGNYEEHDTTTTYDINGNPIDPLTGRPPISTPNSIDSLNANATGSIPSAGAGNTSPLFDSSTGSSISSGLSFAGKGVSAIAPKSSGAQVASSTLSGAGTGAALGTEILPGWGTAIGAVVGAGVGLFAGESKKHQEDIARKQQMDAMYNSQASRQKAYDMSTLATYNQPSQMRGYYKYGGMLSHYKGTMSPLKMEDPMNIKNMITPSFYPKKQFADGGDTTLMRKPIMPSINDPYWRTHQLMTEHTDGSYRQWGENPLLPPINSTANGNPIMIDSSDKASGTSNLYYSPNIQMKTKTPQTIHSTSGMYGDGGSIHIKHPGAFTAYKKRTGNTTQQALHSSDAHVRKMAQFAENASHWKHAYGGHIEGLISPFHTGNIIERNGKSYADGGVLASDMQQFNGPSHDNGGIPIDTDGDGQPNAEVEGGEVQKGNQIFSDRLKPTPQLIEFLKQNKVNTDGTYADIAARLGKKKGVYEAKLMSHSPIALRTGQAMHDRNEQMIQALFQDQEQSKQMGMQPHYAFGGTLPTFADGGDMTTGDPVDPRDKNKTAALQAQLAAFDKHYADLQAQANQAGISAAKKRQLQSNLSTLKGYRDAVAKGVGDYGQYYNETSKTLAGSLKNYDPTSWSQKLFNTVRDPNDVNQDLKGYSSKIDNGLQMLKRLQTVDPNKMDGSDKWMTDAGLAPVGKNYSMLHSNEKGYYPLDLNGNPQSPQSPVAPKAPATATTPAINAYTPPNTESTPLVKSGARTTAIKTRANITPTRQPLINLPNETQDSVNNISLPTNSNTIPTSSTLTTPSQPAQQGDDFLKNYGADILNTANYIGNESRIAGMKAPQFSYMPAPAFNYTDRSGLARYNNSVEAKAAMAGVTNTSGQGQTAQKAQIFGQELNAGNQISNQENMRRDAYIDSYNNRALQTQYTNTDIANRQADVTTQVGNDKIALGIQNQNSFNQGEITNQATRDQNELDLKKGMMIMMGTQDPDKLNQYLNNPDLMRRLRLSMRGNYGQ